MKTNKKVIYWMVMTVLVVLTVWFGYFGRTSAKPPGENKVPVEVQTVGTDSIEETIELTGWVEANSVVVVKSKVPGRIESLRVAVNGGETIPVEEGVKVNKGAQICVVDHDVYSAQVSAAQAGVRAREVELADGEREKKRMTALYEGGSATAQSKDKAITAADLAAANLASARAGLELAEINLRESSIVSPIDGVITARHIDEGNLINAGDRIVTIADVSTVKIVVAAAEKYATKTATGMPVRVSVDAFSNRQFDANIYSVYPALDQQTHTIQVEIRLKNDEMLLKPGMFARVILITKRSNNVVVISRDVVLGGKVDKPYVYVVENSVAQAYSQAGHNPGRQGGDSRGVKGR